MGSTRRRHRIYTYCIQAVVSLMLRLASFRLVALLPTTLASVSLISYHLTTFHNVNITFFISALLYLIYLIEVVRIMNLCFYSDSNYMHTFLRFLAQVCFVHVLTTFFSLSPRFRPQSVTLAKLALYCLLNHIITSLLCHSQPIP